MKLTIFTNLKTDEFRKGVFPWSTANSLGNITQYVWVKKIAIEFGNQIIQKPAFNLKTGDAYNFRYHASPAFHLFALSLSSFIHVLNLKSKITKERISQLPWKWGEKSSSRSIVQLHNKVSKCGSHHSRICHATVPEYNHIFLSRSSVSCNYKSFFTGSLHSPLTRLWRSTNPNIFIVNSIARSKE